MKSFFSIIAAGISIMSAASLSAAIPSVTVRNDGRIEFSLRATHADSVIVEGSWGDPIPMKKSTDGAWCAVSDSLPSDDYWYTFNVDGLRSVDPENPCTVRDINSVMSSVITPGEAADYYLPHDVPHGVIIHPWYNSASLHSERRMSVYLPPDYYTSSVRLPVVYLLHGTGGDENAWLELGHAAQIMDNMIAHGEIEPAIVVVPNCNAKLDAAPGFSSLGQFLFEEDMSNAEPDQFEAAFPEIVAFVDSAYRTIPEAGARAIAGLSMGGGQVWNIARLYPDLATNIGLFSAAVGWNGVGIDSDPFYSIADGSYAAQNIWIGIGRDDFLYDLNEQFRNKLDQHSVPYFYYESDGGHSWSNWRRYLMQYLRALRPRSPIFVNVVERGLSIEGI